jgi:RNA polymerase sigma-70 factor (ECF subfamily)
MDLPPDVIADEPDEATLLAAAQAGDERAFDVLLCRHRPGLAVYCALMIGEPRTADDALREVLALAWQERSLIPASATARIWLYRIAVGVCFEAIEGGCDEISQRRSFDEEDGR